jgi:hypothetical protein
MPFLFPNQCVEVFLCAPKFGVMLIYSATFHDKELVPLQRRLHASSSICSPCPFRNNVFSFYVRLVVCECGLYCALFVMPLLPYHHSLSRCLLKSARAMQTSCFRAHTVFCHFSQCARRMSILCALQNSVVADVKRRISTGGTVSLPI